MLKFWQVIAAIIIFKSTDFAVARAAFAATNAVETFVVFLLWLLIAAVIWVVSYYVFRAVDNATHD